MALGDGTGHDEASPADSDLVSTYPVQQRDMRKSWRIRQDKEHVAVGSSSAGGEHKPGSAKVYVASSAPTTRPDGATAFDSNDQGRLWLYNNTLKVLDNAGAWQYAQPSWALLRESQNSGNDSGSASAGAWTKRVLAEITDVGGIVSVSSGAFTLASAGRYRIRGWMVMYQVDGFQARIRQTSGSAASVGLGSAGFSSAGPTAAGGDAIGGNALSVVECEVVQTGSVTYELQYFCNTAKSTNGLGQKVNSGEREIFAELTIEKIL